MDRKMVKAIEKKWKDDALSEQSSPFCVGCAVRIRSCRIDMCYPANSTRLGTLRVENVVLTTKLDLYQTNEMLSMSIHLTGMQLDDRSPYYSELYPVKAVLCSNSELVASQTEVELIKYFGDDPNRECDLKLSVIVPEGLQLYYIHTHR
ncbi:unnamed protein product [Nippostrongylus brasiliensis]|uniref:Trafficking protein particle complex subunit 9 n=1 Tax=Nippostrongylus brasiliensis TaxID=27835 RepID=A0A0N4YZS0_NIPBR|nr:unnamed protein product [Nippostrongylus brasiliensis]